MHYNRQSLNSPIFSENLVGSNSNISNIREQARMEAQNLHIVTPSKSKNYLVSRNLKNQVGKYYYRLKNNSL